MCQYSNPEIAFKKYRARTLGIIITKEYAVHLIFLMVPWFLLMNNWKHK